MTLTSFINANQRLVTVIGVFTALALFWSNLPLKELGAFGSFWCLLVTIPVFFEIYRNFDGRRASWTLIVFMNLLVPVIYYTVVYVFIAFRPQWKFQMSNLIFWFITIPLWLVYKKLGISKRVSPKIAKSRFFIWDRRTEKYLREARQKVTQTVSDWPVTQEGKQEYLNRNEVLWNSIEARIAKTVADVYKAANVVAIVVICVFSTVISNRTAPWVNSNLDDVYKSYAGKDQSPSNSTGKPSPTPVPIDSATPKSE